MLKTSGKYLITETNKYNESITYTIVYEKTNETTLNLNVDGKTIKVNRTNYQVINGLNIIVKSLNNVLDSDGVIVVANLRTKQVNLYDYEEFVNKQFNTDSYLVSLIDRSGNVYTMVLNCGNLQVTSLTSLINSVKNQNTKIYNYILKYGVSAVNGTYNASSI